MLWGQKKNTCTHARTPHLTGRPGGREHDTYVSGLLISGHLPCEPASYTAHRPPQKTHLIKLWFLPLLATAPVAAIVLSIPSAGGVHQLMGERVSETLVLLDPALG
jgi:hypothetical protein